MTFEMIRERHGVKSDLQEGLEVAAACEVHPGLVVRRVLLCDETNNGASTACVVADFVASYAKPSVSSPLGQAFEKAQEPTRNSPYVQKL